MTGEGVARNVRALLGWALVAAVGTALLWPRAGAAQPGQDAAEALRRGEELYAIHCGGCHGVDGRGGETIAGLDAPPLRPDMNDRVTISYARLVMDTGRMPPAGDPEDNRIRDIQLEEDERADILLFMTDRFGLEGDIEDPGTGDVSAGLQVYAANCAQCHGASGAGGVAGGGAWTPRVNNLSSQTLADAIRTGPFQMPRFDEQQITDQEIADIAAFLHQVEQEGGTLLFPGELNPVFASGFGAGLAAVILVLLLVIAGKPRLFPDQPAPRAADDDEERKG